MTDQSNPLLSDPSIIRVSTGSNATNINTENTNTNTSETNISGTDLDSLEPRNALSQLLDSAMSNAAKESSPEFEQRTSSGANSAVNSPRSLKFNRFEFTAVKSSYDNIYTIEELLSLKHTAVAFVADQIPPPDFWRIGKKFKKEFPPNSKYKKHNKRDFEQKKKRPEVSDGYNGGEDQWSEDSHMSEKLKLEMGDTVEDFERWKQSQRRKDGGSAGAPPSGTGGGFFEPEPQPVPNEVDNFFSFVKPSSTEDKGTTTDSSRSSRFSSFFTTPAEKPEEKPAESASRFFGGASAPSVPVGGSPQVHAQPLSSSAGSNEYGQPGSNSGTPQFANQPVNVPRRSFSGPGTLPPHVQQQQQQQQNQTQGRPQQQQPQYPHQYQQQHPQSGLQHPPQPQGPPMGFPSGMSQPPPGFPANNDSFFLSLLKKAPEEGSNNSPQKQQQQQNQLPPWFNKLNAPPGMPLPQGQNFQGQNYPQGSQNNPQGQPQGQMPMRFPPGMQPQQQGPPGQPHQGLPGPQQGPPGLPGQGQAREQGQDKSPNAQAGPNGPNGHNGPNQFYRPPPGMYPPGVLPPGVYPQQYDPNMMRNMPPPGMQGPGGQQQQGGPQYMQFPPGMAQGQRPQNPNGPVRQQ